MRIISGMYGGRILAAPKGTDTRPTTDRAREALMSSLESIRGTLDGAVVLDAFGGSGALSFEVISRGGTRAVIYDMNEQAARVVVKNRRMLGLNEDAVSIKVCDIFKHPPRSTTQPFDIVFFDPPYKTDPLRVRGLADGLYDAGILAPSALLVYEHAKKCNSEALGAFGGVQWEIVTYKTYGDASIFIIRKGTE